MNDSGPANRDSLCKEPRKILLIRTGDIGDCLLTTPAIEALHNRFPASRIDTLSGVATSEIFAANPFVSQTISFTRRQDSMWPIIRRIRAVKYDLLIDFHATPRTFWLAVLGGIPCRMSYGSERIGFRARAYNLHGTERGDYSAFGRMNFLKALDVEPIDPTPYFPVDRDSLVLADQFFAAAGVKEEDEVVALSPTSAYECKMWPMEHWAELARRLHQAKIKLVAVRSPGDEQNVQEISRLSQGALLISPSGTLKYLGAIFQRARLVISDCSGPRHIAVSQHIPTLTLHGATDEIPWTHPAPVHRTLAGDIECRPCLARNDCRFHTVECMRLISVDTVYATALEMLQKKAI